MKTDRRVVTFYEGLSGERGESVSVQREKEERVDGKRQLSRSGETNLSRPVQSCTNRSRQPQSYNSQPQSYHNQPQSYNNQPQSYNSQPQSYHNQPQSFNQSRPIQPPRPMQQPPTQPRPIQPPPPYHHNNQTYLPRPTIPIKTYEQRPSAFPTSTKTTQMKTMTSTKKNSLQSLASSLASYNLSHSSLVSLSQTPTVSSMESSPTQYQVKETVLLKVNDSYAMGVVG